MQKCAMVNLFRYRIIYKNQRKKIRGIMFSEGDVKIQELFDKKAERSATDARWGVAFTIITILGAAGVGAALMLSEILYAEIEELSECPEWYRAFLFLSLGLSAVGVFGCAISKKPHNGALYLRYTGEWIYYYIVMAIGFVMMIVSALVEKENYFLDLLICFGGALCFFGLAAFCGSAAGVFLFEKKVPYLKILYGFLRKKNDIVLRKSASVQSVTALSECVNANLPKELIDLYLQTDGDGDLLFSAAEAEYVTRSVRENLCDFNPEIASILCFAGDGSEYYFCYKIDEKSNVIYSFNLETLEIIPIADDLIQLIGLYYGNYWQ